MGWAPMLLEWRTNRLNNWIVLTNDVHLCFVPFHSVNRHTWAMDGTKANISWCSARRENISPTSAGLPSLGKHFRFTWSMIELVSTSTGSGTQTEWKLHTGHNFHQCLNNSIFIVEAPNWLQPTSAVLHYEAFLTVSSKKCSSVIQLVEF